MYKRTIYIYVYVYTGLYWVGIGPYWVATEPSLTLAIELKGADPGLIAHVLVEDQRLDRPPTVDEIIKQLCDTFPASYDLVEWQFMESFVFDLSSDSCCHLYVGNNDTYLYMIHTRIMYINLLHCCQYWLAVWQRFCSRTYNLPIQQHECAKTRVHNRDKYKCFCSQLLV